MLLEIKDIQKKYSGGKNAIKCFSLQSNHGIIGLLGPNGAGKSTLMRMMATIAEPTSGSYYWKGTDVLRHPELLRNELGYLPQNFGLFPNLTAFEFLQYMAALKNISPRNKDEKIMTLLDEVNLLDVAHKKIGSFSGGMKQRVGIAQALLNDPEIILLDEPSVGLDPEERLRLRNLLAELSGSKLILLSSHIVSDIESLADSIAILNRGELMVFDEPGIVLESVMGIVYEKLIGFDKWADFVKKHKVISYLKKRDKIKVRFFLYGNENDLVLNATPVQANLEDAYLWFLKFKNGSDEEHTANSAN